MRRLAALAFVLLTGCATPPAAAPGVEALPATGWRGEAMVAAADPMAVEAGLDVLRRGGSAMDAAVAVQAMLGLVEPQSSGIGGGAFILHYDAATGDVTAYDGREVAPATARPDMFLGADGKPLPFFDAVKSGRSIGVPGAIAVLAMAQAEHGRLAWRDLFGASIKAAREGFPAPRRLSRSVAMIAEITAPAPDLAAYLMPGGAPIAEGATIRNAAYAETLERIAADGARGFYSGPVADAIVASANRAPGPSGLTAAELAAYEPRKLEPICRPYRVYLVCGMGPPSSGGIAVLATLTMLERFDLSKTGPSTAEGWHLFVEAQRLAYADRDKYVADDRFVAVPVEGLLDRDYLASRSALIRTDQAMAQVEAGFPPGARRAGLGTPDASTGTSHFVVIDARGNAVSMTTTVEAGFGSQRMAAGFFLNNQLTDFSFRPTDEAGAPVANAVAPGKKPRSSMAPTLIFEDGALRMAVGSPGGNAIIAYVAKTIVGTLDWGLSIQAAADLPNVIARGEIVAERDRFPAALRAALEAMGHVFREGRGGENSGIHGIVVRPDGGLEGAADGRRDGVARRP